jgi:hypothetical protein
MRNGRRNYGEKSSRRCLLQDTAVLLREFSLSVLSYYYYYYVVVVVLLLLCCSSTTIK